MHEKVCDKKIIPIMHCFDDNYAMPASVAFLSMLEHADNQYIYKIYVLHSDISLKHQQMLISVVSKFENATLEFINMENEFDNLFKSLKFKGHYSEEMFYKFLPERIFLDYEKIIIADVDVLYQGDISKEFINFDINQDYYLAAHKASVIKDSWVDDFYNKYYKNFSHEEKNKLYTCAGYWIFNLKKMRADKMSEKFIDFASKNSDRIVQPEQDTVNLVCYPKIKFLPANTIVCAYTYVLAKNNSNLKKDRFYSDKELIYALKNPIQIHFATSVKPWNNSSCEKSKLWFEYLFRTPFAWEYVESAENLKLWNNPLFFSKKVKTYFKNVIGKILKLNVTKMRKQNHKLTIPLVSVLCCTYNHRNFIETTLNSILNQKTDFPLEIIVSDDASNDGTKEIIEKFVAQYPNRIKAILRKNNVGVGENYYNALKEVSGKYLAICNGDDFWLDEYKLQKQVSFLENNSDYSVCCSDVLRHYVDSDKQDEIFSVRAYMPKRMRKKKAFSFDDLLYCRFIASATCVLRWQMKNNIPAWLKKHCVIDFPLILIHSMLGKIKVFDEVFAQYNIHKQGVSRQHNQAFYKKKMNDILNFVDNYTDGYHSAEIKKFIEQTGRNL